MIAVCPICSSEKRYGRRCEACHDMTDEEWALHDARVAYAEDRIDVGELERRIAVALTSPPKRHHPHLVYC